MMLLCAFGCVCVCVCIFALVCVCISVVVDVVVLVLSFLYLLHSVRNKLYIRRFTVRPWDNRGKCYMNGKRIQFWSNAYTHLYL